MEDAKAAWNEVGSKFGELGEKLKEHFERPRPSATGAAAPAEGTAVAEAGPDTGAEPGGAAEPGTTDAVRDALRNLCEALNGAVEAVGAAAKDPEITGEMRQVGQALVNALAATFTDVGEDIRRSFSRSRSAGEEPAAGEKTPPDGPPQSGPERLAQSESPAGEADEPSGE